MGSLIKIRNNLFSLASAEIFTKLLGAFMYFILARYLGPREFGVYSVATSFSIIFGLISGLGIDSYIVKEIARGPERTQVLFDNGVILKMLGGLLAFLLAVSFCFILSYDSTTRWAIIIFSCTLFFSSLTGLYDSIFRGLQRMEFSAMISIGRSVLSVMIIITMILFRQSILMIVSAHVITGIVLSLFLYLFVVRTKFCRFSFNISRSDSYELLKGGLPFIATGVVYVINVKADVLLLSKLADLESVGIYDAANEVILLLMILPSLVSQVLYPYLSQQFAKQREGLAEIINFSLKVMTILSVPMSFGLVILAPKLIHLFYGQKYAASAIVLQIMGAGLSIVFLRSLLGWVLAAIEKVNMMMWVNFYNLVLNVLFNVLLIPRYGYTGAAVATITSMIFGTLIVLRVIDKEVQGMGSVIILYVKPVFAGVLMAAFLIAFFHLNVILLVIMGAIVYFSGLILIKTLTAEEWNILRGLTPFARR